MAAVLPRRLSEQRQQRRPVQSDGRFHALQCRRQFRQDLPPAPLLLHAEATRRSLPRTTRTDCPPVLSRQILHGVQPPLRTCSDQHRLTEHPPGQQFLIKGLACSSSTLAAWMVASSATPQPAAMRDGPQILLGR